MKSQFFRLTNFSLRLLPYILVFIVSFAHPIDFDLGWHLKFGQEFVDQGIFNSKNSWSSEMDGYQWFNSSWALDIYRYIIFQKGGFLATMTHGALVVTLMFFIVSKTYSLNIFEKSLLFPLLLFVEDPMNSHSYRGQQWSLMLISFLILILFHFQKKGGKILYSLIPIFLLWSNWHAQFMLGLGLYILWTTIYLIQHRSKTIQNHIKYIIIPLCLSILATLINPYGIGLYEESIAHFGNPALKHITEFAQLSYFSTTFVITIIWGLASALSILILHKKKSLSFYIPILVATAILFVLSFLSGRFVWSMYIVSIPFLVVLIRSFPIKDKSLQTTLGVSLILGELLFAIFYVLPIRQIGTPGWDSFCRLAGCSPQAAQILSKYYSAKRIFTDYNLGGWLIWNYPEIKPGMDGRMPLWEDYAGRNAFEEYYAIENAEVDPDKTPYRIIFIGNNRPLSVVLNGKVVYDKTWRIVFRDDRNTIYERMK